MEFILLDTRANPESRYDPDIGRVRIAATLSEFQIHTSCTIEHLPEIRANIESALQEAQEKLSYDDTQMDYAYGFLCQNSKCKGQRGRHVATVCNGFTSCKCIHGTGNPKRLSKTQQPWFPQMKDEHQNEGVSVNNVEASWHDLCTELEEVAPEWYRLGIQLKLSATSLKIIETDNSGDCRMCLNKMLDEWLKNSDDKSWNTVANALEEISQKNLARKIGNKYVSEAHT